MKRSWQMNTIILDSVARGLALAGGPIFAGSSGLSSRSGARLLAPQSSNDASGSSGRPRPGHIPRCRDPHESWVGDVEGLKSKPIVTLITSIQDGHSKSNWKAIKTEINHVFWDCIQEPTSRSYHQSTSTHRQFRSPDHESQVTL